MPRPRRTRNVVKFVEYSSSEDEEVVEKIQKKPKVDDGSSSESDIESYLKKPEELNLNSTFFKVDKSQNVKPKIEDKMSRPRRTRKDVKCVEESGSEGDEQVEKIQKKPKVDDGSSSESDIETYLKKPEELNLNSTFFKVDKTQNVKSFNDIEKEIFSGVNRLSDSDSEMEDVEENKEKKTEDNEIVPVSFEQLNEFTKKIEDAKKYVEMYQAKKKKQEEENLDINTILTIGENNFLNQSNESQEANSTLRSSEFESLSDSEKEDWEEVAEAKEAPSTSIPKEGVQITLQMPQTIQKKKGVDLLAAMKRRLNRIKKENQVFIHKVHLLTWIAHGNYVNETLNKETLMAMALSLLPSQQCYPSNRTDLKYLEQIVNWYKRTVKIVEKSNAKELTLENNLRMQINKKEANDKKMFVYIFICILRSLGIQCRLVLSLQVEPLKPPASELCSLSTKEDKKDSKKGSKGSGGAKVDEKVKIGEKSGETSSLSVKGKEKNDDVKEENLKEKGGNKDREKKIVETIKRKVAEKRKIIGDDKATDKEVKKIVAGSSKKNDIENGIADKDLKNIVAGSSKKNDIEDGNENKDVKKIVAGTSKKNDNGKVDEECTTIKTLEDDGKNVTREKKTREKSKKETSSKLETRSKKLKTKIEEDINSKIAALENLEKEEIKSTRRSTRSTNTTSKTNKSSEKTSVTKKRKSDDVPQLDGNFDSQSDEEIPTTSAISKPKLKKLKELSIEECPRKRHPRRLKTKTNYVDDISEDEEKPRSPFTAKNVNSPGVSKNLPAKVNLNVLKEGKVSKNKGADKVNLKVLKAEGNKKGSNLITKQSEVKNKANLEAVKSESPKKSSSKSDNENSRFFNSPKKQDVKDDIIKLVKGRINQNKGRNHRRSQSESDSDFAPEVITRKKKNPNNSFAPKVKVKKRVLPKSAIDRRVFSSDDEEKPKVQKQKGIDIWIEVYLEAEEKWISADVIKGKVHCIKDLASQASHPISYILSWDNTNRIKDITKRYCPNWNTVTRKLRTDPKWWSESLKPFIGKKTSRDREEDEDLARQQLEQPLPKTISEYKNHPLYVLTRHLLKFQAIYPPDSVTLGFVRNEPVYSRDCVYTLHSREIWVKHAKVVKPKEVPYKIVKARPKYDKLSNTCIKDQPLEIFGEWQVEDYVPPTAENGIVPRNAYGNVELFKPCMLPKKTVHLQLPGLNKVARKLNIDCAPAVVGFDYHSGGSHPTFDGYVVCEEFEEQIIAAWYIEQEEAEKREKEKYEKRVFGNWRRLIKGLLIRERLKARYDFGETKKEKPAETKKKGPRFLTKKKTL